MIVNDRELLRALVEFGHRWLGDGVYQRARTSDDYKIFNVIRPA